MNEHNSQLFTCICQSSIMSHAMGAADSDIVR